ncbi:MAG: metal-dependent hydrolase [Myxococcales bacterium]|nr:metal-dependent hydrolase [Myxococcales bacterium]
MATVFTHAFLGASIASLPRAPVGRSRICLVAGLLAAAPDLDVAAFALGIPYDHPLGHRGLTHSLAFAAVVGTAAGAALTPRRDIASIAKVSLVLAVAMASHGLLDALTDAGLGIGFLLPFDEARIFFPWRPLATSPLGIAAFFSGPAAAILLNELLVIWIPTLLFLLFRHRSWKAHRGVEP